MNSLRAKKVIEPYTQKRENEQTTNQQERKLFFRNRSLLKPGWLSEFNGVPFSSFYTIDFSYRFYVCCLDCSLSILLVLLLLSDFFLIFKIRFSFMFCVILSESNFYYVQIFIVSN